MAQASTLVTVLVTDVNDNKPHFYQCPLSTCDFIYTQSNFTGSIVEHSPSKVPVSNLNIVARDPDKVGAIAGAVLLSHCSTTLTLCPSHVHLPNRAPMALLSSTCRV